MTRDPDTGFWQAFLTLYMEIVEKGTDPVHKVMTHARDHPDEPCLIHCTGMNSLSIYYQDQASDAWQPQPERIGRG